MRYVAEQCEDSNRSSKTIKNEKASDKKQEDKTSVADPVEFETFSRIRIRSEFEVKLL